MMNSSLSPVGIVVGPVSQPPNGIVMMNSTGLDYSERHAHTA